MNDSVLIETNGVTKRLPAYGTRMRARAAMGTARVHLQPMRRAKQLAALVTFKSWRPYGF